MNHQMMAAYDPRIFHMHTGIHPSVLSGVGQRYPHPGANVTNIPTVAAPQQRQVVPTTDIKQKAGPGWENTYRTAQNIAFPDPKSACGERVGEWIEDLARGIGCPVEYVLVPLLPCVGSLLGTNTTIRVHRAWAEPPIVWSIVGASSGSRRSAVIRQLLAPILGIQAQRNKDAPISRVEESMSTSSHVNGYENTDSDDENEHTTIKRGSTQIGNHNRALYSGTRITQAALTEVLHRNNGHAFSLTENVHTLHEVLGLVQPVISQRLVSVLEDLYEGLPLVAVEDGRVTTILGSNFNHGGFASPEYVVTMMVKSPPWLSARLLLSCPQADDMKGVFGEPSTDAELPELENIYSVLLDMHQEKHKYVFDSDAVQELSKFFDEEWSTVLNQLDQNEHEGIIGKSMGQIVRLCGILKALDNSIIATTRSHFEDWDWNISVDTVKCAINLGKYFLEQKLAMTFMVGTGFFSHASDSFIDNNVTECNNQATTLPQTAVHDSPDAAYQTSPFSNSKSSSSHAPSPMAQASTPRPMNQDSNLSTSQQSPNSSFGLPRQPGEVDFSTLPHTMTTVEEDVSEMMQAVDFVHFSKTQFVAVHGRRIKRLLECYDDGHGVSATTAAQKSITPPVRIEGTNNRHPAWASALFFPESC
uniref:DUF3987 domain-containing protein n=1 Tax=Arion vulgaris TaxID=1028688 RepID=A0A0B7AHL5_9EUPU